MAVPTVVRSRRVGAAIAIVAGSATLLSGCSLTPTVCPADLIADHFTIVATSESHPHPSLQVCVETSCTEVVSDLKGESGYTSGSKRHLGVYVRKADHWTVSVFDGKDPAAVTARLFSGETSLAVQTIKLRWHRGDPKDVCHAWRTVDEVHIELP